MEFTAMRTTGTVDAYEPRYVAYVHDRTKTAIGMYKTPEAALGAICADAEARTWKAVDKYEMTERWTVADMVSHQVPLDPPFAHLTRPEYGVIIRPECIGYCIERLFPMPEGFETAADEFSAMKSAMWRQIEPALTQGNPKCRVSKRSGDVVFLAPPLGLSGAIHLSDDLETARAQMRAAGIDYRQPIDRTVRGRRLDIGPQTTRFSDGFAA